MNTSMRQFLADLHIHSRFSRATSPKLAPPLLAAWAGIKGLSVIGSGDFTHPIWRKELADTLLFEEESGLYRLRDEVPAAALRETLVPGLSPAMKENARPVRFMLQGEISSIYKRGGKVRKVHNLVYVPTLEVAESLSRTLGEVGNLHSDGRPILGLDSRDLLEMVLQAHPQAFLVPAHIWTPWFSLFGSKSGFDDIHDCYGDMTSHIFALETGLSSDPAMNRLWSALDGFRMVSNSDAHSGENLGREANVFRGRISYDGMLRALKEPERAGETTFCGTVEFYPEEGKYHMDGHRKCDVLLRPEETRAVNGICPVCGEALTVGVLHRVMELADRTEPVYPEGEKTFSSLVPLAEVLGEILGVGPKSRKVGDMYAKTLAKFGTELDVLLETPTADLARFFPPLGEAVDRMRRGEVILQGGYDGEYGIVRMFTEAEQREIQRGAAVGKSASRKGSGAVQGLSLMEGVLPETAVKTRKKRVTAPKDAPERTDVAVSGDPGSEDFTFSVMEKDGSPFDDDHAPDWEAADGDMPLNPEQEHAVVAGPGPVLVLAGPGTGKTRTLVARIMHLLDEGISAHRVIAVTFTRRAALEMDARLTAALGSGVPLPRTDTLHAIALELWHRTHDTPVLLSEENARRVFAEANVEEPAQAVRDGWDAINLARERLESPAPEYVEMAGRYFRQKAAWNLADYTDLLEFWLEQSNNGLFVNPWGQVLVDEVQDLSPLQLAIIRALLSSSGEGFFGIGDPDQSIYGFRGAHGQCLDFFRSAWPGLTVISLTRNYRTLPRILTAASAVMDDHSVCGTLTPMRSGEAPPHFFEALTAQGEADWIADRVRALIGMGGHTLMDAAPAQSGFALPDASCSPGDIAVLVRTHAFAPGLRKALERAGVPVTQPSADAFWEDPRVTLILRAAGRMFGIAIQETPGQDEMPLCPDKIFAKGPLGISAYFSSIPPFDALFWKGSAFKALSKAFDLHKGWAGLLTWINLQNELELVRAKGEKVQILSLHAAKGLEFPVVFLPCLEDGLMPFAGPGLLTGKTAKYAADVDEERRLLYVGITRAKDALFLSCAARRPLYGRDLRLKPSRFLAKLPQGLFTHSAMVGHSIRQETQLTLLS